MAVSIVSAIWATAWRDGCSESKVCMEETLLDVQSAIFQENNSLPCNNLCKEFGCRGIHHNTQYILTPVDERLGLQGMQT